MNCVLGRVCVFFKLHCLKKKTMHPSFQATRETANVLCVWEFSARFDEESSRESGKAAHSELVLTGILWVYFARNSDTAELGKESAISVLWHSESPVRLVPSAVMYVHDRSMGVWKQKQFLSTSPKFLFLLCLGFCYVYYFLVVVYFPNARSVDAYRR